MDLELKGKTRADQRQHRRHRPSHRDRIGARRRARHRQWPVASRRRRGCRGDQIDDRRRCPGLRRRPQPGVDRRGARATAPWRRDPGEQSRHLRAEAVRRHPGRGLAAFFDVNVLSGVRLARLYLPAMKRSNWGRIIFISSESAVQIPAEMIHYGMTKTAAARGLARPRRGARRHRDHSQLHFARPDEIARGR